MNIFERASSILSSNINALLDKCEDPSKMVDQYLREAMDDFAEVKKETAGIMAIEKKAEREYLEIKSKYDKYTEMAKKAVKAGNDDDARVILSKRASIESSYNMAKQNYEAAMAKSKQIKQVYDKLKSDIESLQARRQNVKTQMSMAKAQEKLNKFSDSTSKIGGSLGAFSRMEEKAQAMFDSSSAYASLDSLDDSSDISSLEAKYGDIGVSCDSEVEDALAALKSEM